MNLKPALFLLLVFFIGNSINAQQRIGNFIAYGREAGLQTSLNYTVFQSSDGYLWIGTASGLFRFDGKRYKTFFSNYTDPNSPSDNFIVDIAEDKNNNLWFGGLLNGVTKYNPRTGQFKQYPKLSSGDESGYGIYAIYKDKTGDLWFATAGRGLAKYVYEKDSFRLFMPDPSKTYDGSVKGINYVSDISADRIDSNILWLSCFDGLYSFNKKNYSFRKFSGPETEKLSFISIETDSDNNLWLGNSGSGIFFFNTVSQSFQRVYSPGNKNWAGYMALDIKQVNDSLLYVAAGNDGLFSINFKTKKIENIAEKQRFSWPVTDPGIQKISLTSSAGIFAGGSNYIYQFHPAFSRFSNLINFQRNKLNGAGSIFLNHAVYDTKRDVYWMACYNVKGLYKISSGFNTQHIIEAKENTLDEISFLDVCVVGDLVLAVGEISGLWVLDEKSGQFKLAKDLFPGSDTVFSKIIRVEADRKGNCWFLTGDRLLYWDIKNNEIRSVLLTRDPSFKNTTGISSVRFIADQDNNAWVATNIGLFFCEPGGKLKHIIPKGKTEYDLANLSIKSMTIDKYGNPWLGYNGEGLQVMSAQKKTIVSFHNLDGGLPAMQINYLATDTAGRIWAATDPGLAIFDPKMKAWQLYNRHDGIGRDYMDRPVIACSNGMMIVDQVNGFSGFDCSKVQANSEVPIIHITSLKVNGSEFKSSILPDYFDKIELPWHTNDLNIEFAAMDWLYPFRTRYYYLVEGIHKPDGWVRISEGSVNLEGLKPGHYRLRMKALNSNGLWSNLKYQKYLDIVITPPFWQRWWFIGICVLLLAALFYAIYRYRLRQIMHLQNVRNNISQNLHDDIGASLSNINILNELTQRNIRDEVKATSYLSKASDDIQRISESLSDIVWNINPKYDDLNNLFIRMKRYAADMMDGKLINCDLVFPDENPGTNLSMDKRRDFYMIFKEAVNNLAKYSKATQAKVQVFFQDSDLVMVVEDNGKGFDLKETGFGNGLQNMKLRAEKWEAKLLVKTSPGKGTLVRLEMKI